MTNTSGPKLRSRIVTKANSFVDLATHYGLRLTSIGTCSRFGGYVGRNWVPRKHEYWDKRARDNLCRLKPDMLDRDIEKQTARRWGNIGRSFAEFSVLDRIIPDGRLAIAGADNVKPVLDAGKPLLVAGLHLGNSNLIHAALISMGFNTASVVQFSNNKTRDLIAEKARKRFDVSLFPPGPNSALKVVRHLQNNNCQVLYIDEIINGRVGSPLFGRLPKLLGNIAYIPRLAAMTGATVVMGYCVRIKECEFVTTFSEPFDFKTTRDNDRWLSNDIALIDEMAEKIVFKHLDQWFMLHQFRFDR